MAFSKLKPFLKAYLISIVLAAVWFLYAHIHVRGIWFYFVGLIAAAAFVLGVIVFMIPATQEIKLRLKLNPKALKILVFSLATVLVVIFFTVNLGLIAGGSGRMLLAFLFAGLAALLTFFAQPERSPFLIFVEIILFIGTAYRLAAFLPEIQTGPFSLGWSEGSRYYNASMFLSERIYQQKLPLPVLHPSRYLLQAVPFFLGIKAILAQRIWQVFLWIWMTGLGATLFARRVKDGLKLPFVLLVMWFFLFFFQGAVYYHLMLCVILVLLGYKAGSPWRTLFFVMLASLWAGISRLNWMPVPGLMATALYLLDTPFDGKKVLNYLSFPALWTVLGFGAALLSQQAYVLFSGEAPELFNSAFSSALLWQRLLPNATFTFGILPGIGLVCLPLAVLVWQKLREPAMPRLHWLRWLGLAGILAVFLVGGILVSLKIGGGGDLHNLDAFLVFFALILSSILAGNLSSDAAVPAETQAPRFQPLWLMLAVIVPVFFSFMRGGSWQFIGSPEQEAEVQQIQAALDLVADAPGEVLFISERQLLTFGEVEGVRVVPEYEKVFLMEMAMGNNQDYLHAFYDDLQSHRFKLIITDTINANLQGPNRSFAMENNAWVEKVLVPMLQVYEPVLDWHGGEAHLLIPAGQKKLKESLLEIQN